MRSLTLALAIGMTATAASAQSKAPEPVDPAAAGDGRYIVKFRDLSRGAANIAAAGGRLALELRPQNAMAAYLPEAALRALQRNPNVEYVETDVRRYPSAETTPWGIGKVQANDAVFTGNSLAGSGPMVCIIDSGLHTGHEDFAPYQASITGAGTSTWSFDGCGHGTHVAGTIAAVGGNGNGVVGVAPKGNVRMHIVKVFGNSTPGNCAWSYASTLVSALNDCTSKATSEGRNLVVNMSLGGGAASSTENTAFQNAYNTGKVLSIAAAGNGGNTAISYPAGYASVVSVAATDANNAKASFSQANADVELAAPGVDVLSTTGFKVSSLTVGTDSRIGAHLEGASRTAATAPLVDGGLCTAAGAWSGQVVLCQRGTNSFGQKVANVQAGGGVGAVIYNNVAGGFSGTLGTGVTSPLPAISISQEDGQALVASAMGASGTLDNSVGVTGQYYSGYEHYSGTSMATPHVAGVAALVWSLNPSRTAAELRDALQRTALDLGTAGRDNSFGFGLVQAKAAHQLLQAPVTAPTLSSASIVIKSRKPYARLVWSGAAGSTVDYHRTSGTTTTKVNTTNDGAQDDGPLTKGVTYTYKVCLTNTQTCSSTRSVTP